jgi:hypothetical protein
MHSLEGWMAGTSQDEIFRAREETCSVNIFSEGKGRRHVLVSA